jgi:hypothetical protein
MIIGFVTGAELLVPLQEAFLSGLRATGWEGDPGRDEGENQIVTITYYSAKGKYDNGRGGQNKHRELYVAIERLDRNNSVDLIVAAGGMVTEDAAYRQCQGKPYIVLCGSTPQYSNKLRGGVNVNLTANLGTRNSAFVSAANIETDRVCLIWNARSLTGHDEAQYWTSISKFKVSVDQNNDQKIKKAFVDAKNLIKDGVKAQGILISPDPFFTSRMDVVVQAAHATGLKICYPFETYKSAMPTNPGGRHIFVGPNPDLAASYYIVGEKVGASLTEIWTNQPVTNKFVDNAGVGGAVIWSAKSQKTKRGKKRTSGKKKRTTKK